MKKTNKIMYAILLIFCFIIGVFLVLNRNAKVSKSIIRYCNRSEETSFEINLTDFTNFDWDNVIIYKNPITNKEIKDLTGIDYKKELDLQSGMIFIKNNKIVYEDKFKTDFESPYIFVIYPYKDINNEKKVNNFSKDNAIFKVEKIKYNSENRYVLIPK